MLLHEKKCSVVLWSKVCSRQEKGQKQRIRCSSYLSREPSSAGKPWNTTGKSPTQASWWDKSMKGHNLGAACISCYSITSSWLHKYLKTSIPGPLEINSTNTMRLNGKHKTSFTIPSSSFVWTGNLSPKKSSQPVMHLNLEHRLKHPRNDNNVKLCNSAISW